MLSDYEDLIKENKTLKRKLKVMEQSFSQFEFIKNKYNNLINRFEEKDKKLLDMNEKLEVLVKARTQELENINSKLEDLSKTDSLTGLKNRRAFDEIYSQEFNRAKRQEYNFNFLIIDVDNFKNYNDTYGHKKGDYVLSKIGKVLDRISSRANDFAFRYGGEEFVYITCFQDKEMFLKTAESIREKIFNLKIFHETGSYDFVSVSIGGAISNNKARTKEDIFDLADDNLYKAKNEGRNKTIITSF